MTGIELIAQERQKQIDKYGFTGQHHAGHPEWYNNFQIQAAAIKLMMCEFDGKLDVDGLLPDGWDYEWLGRMSAKTLEERFIIVGALMAAELDRLNVLKEQRDNTRVQGASLETSKPPSLDFPIEILTRHLINEQEYVNFGIERHPNSRAAFEENNRLARERIPQLREAIKILLSVNGKFETKTTEG
ncbi:MAG TPA: hypothetical protein VFD46_00980 [Chryseolinea sp.]|nr:hypothetical protein [Chryseolinea sp.]